MESKEKVWWTTAGLYCFKCGGHRDFFPHLEGSNFYHEFVPSLNAVEVRKAAAKLADWMKYSTPMPQEFKDWRECSEKGECEGCQAAWDDMIIRSQFIERFLRG